jgi:hypothetical protein
MKEVLPNIEPSEVEYFIDDVDVNDELDKHYSYTADPKLPEPCRKQHSPLVWLLVGVAIIILIEFFTLPRIERMCASAIESVIVNK